MADLSPAAQAVLDAMYQVNMDFDGENARLSAAALRAAADQVVPGDEEPIEPPGYGIGCGPPGYLADWTQWRIRRKFLALATELERADSRPLDSPYLFDTSAKDQKPPSRLA